MFGDVVSSAVRTGYGTLRRKKRKGVAGRGGVRLPQDMK